MSISKLSALSLIVVALLAAACSDDAGTTTTSTGDTTITSDDDVVFASGEMPETIPAGFPVPQGSAIGSTMVVVKTGFTEVVMRVNAEVGVSAEFFNQGLTQGGFAVDSSEATDDGWLIEFSDDGAKGTLELTAPTESLTQAILRYNVP